MKIIARAVLKQEGQWSGKRFHFHFALTQDNLEHTTPETVCRYLTKQWQKIGKSVSEIVPWNSTKTAKGIWYLTQNEETPLHHSRYFHGSEFCHWKMSTLLRTRIFEIANRKENYEKRNRQNLGTSEKHPAELLLAWRIYLSKIAMARSM